MSLNQDFFKRETNIKAKVICDSISEQGIRITTFEVEAPRIILAEINTHNAISKNCSSTRAIALNKAVEQVNENGFTPLYWGKKKSGMSATEEVEFKEISKSIWLRAKGSAVKHVEMLDVSCELHKQISGRLLEPFQMVKQVLTATDWDNFFNLRIHPTSQPEICMLAYKMYQAMQESVPFELKDGEYHLPYINRYRILSGRGVGRLEYYSDNAVLDLETAKKISASCCAQVSYRNTDMSLEKADKIFDMLVKADVLHSSCFEHLATPIKKKVDGIGIVRINCSESNTWDDGITHVNRKGELCSGNLRGWISYRHLLPNNTCWEYDHEERMRMF